LPSTSNEAARLRRRCSSSESSSPTDRARFIER
jgi:hypothetical protein